MDYIKDILIIIFKLFNTRDIATMRLVHKSLNNIIINDQIKKFIIRTNDTNTIKKLQYIKNLYFDINTDNLDNNNHNIITFRTRRYPITEMPDLINITKLVLYRNSKKPRKICNFKFDYLTNLKKLRIEVHISNINDQLSLLTNITKLKIFTGGLSDRGINRMTNLKYLSISNSMSCHFIYTNPIITDNAFQYLTNIKTLLFDHFNKITDVTLYHLTNLTWLSVCQGIRISDNAFRLLPKLLRLDINNYEISGEHITYLTNLVSLHIGISKINDMDISKMTSLTSLSVGWVRISNAGIRNLTNLVSLGMNDIIDRKGIKNLTGLTKLSLNLDVTDFDIKKLTNLKYLHVRNNIKVTPEFINSLPHIKLVYCGYYNNNYKFFKNIFGQRCERDDFSRKTFDKSG